MVEIVTMRKARTLPGQNVNVTMRKATTLPGQNVMERRHADLLVALGALTYLLVAATIGGAVVSAAALGLRAPVLLPAAALALAAYAAEYMSRRARDVLRKNLALAVYVAAALLLPAPWPVLIAAVAIIACQLTRPGALTCAVAWPAVLLMLPFLVAVYWGLEQAPMKQATGDRRQATAERPQEEPQAAAVQAPAVVDAQARLSAVLAAVRELGGNDDLGQVTRTLACAAASLTAFREGTVYLYESHDGLFVPYACNQTEPTSDEAIPRDAAESMMSHRHRLGSSYYARTRREPEA